MTTAVQTLPLPKAGWQAAAAAAGKLSSSHGMSNFEFYPYICARGVDLTLLMASAFWHVNKSGWLLVCGHYCCRLAY